VKYIIADLDGTIANDDHRVHVWAGGNYDECFALQHLDTPNEDVVWLLNSLATNMDIDVLIVTCRPEQFRQQTWDWLLKHNVNGIGRLLMRPEGDRTPSCELKIKMLEKRFGSKQNVLQKVLFVLEDRDKVVKALREYGLKTWHVREGKY
jgi:hypothetical protein